MKNIVVIPNPKKDAGLSVTDRLIKKLISLGLVPYIKSVFFEQLSDNRGAFSYENFPSCADLIIVVGGDGSVIDASKYAVEHDIPLLGVNLGKVGYLSEVEPENISVLSAIVENKYHSEEKMLLAVELNNNGGLKISDRFAVNDVVISHNDFLGISDFSVENSRGDFVKYRADGVIISTPAGSTAYSLSAGGPIISHGVDAITVTPVCPHSFFNRSIVFDGNERVKITNTGDGDLNVSVDGRCFAVLKCGDSCTIMKAPKSFKMITFAKGKMFSTLFRKMRILEDIK